MIETRWGILGTAGIARKAMIPGLRRARGAVLAAVASRDGAKARAFADAQGIPVAYESYEALLADPGIDAVYIPLPNHLHVPLTLQALAAGKHVLCEKPLALLPAEIDGLIAAQQASGKLVAEAFMTRYQPQWLRARALVAEGRIGTLRAVQAVFCYHNTDPANVRNQPGIGGGGMYDIGCYAIAAARWFFGAEPERLVGLADIDPDFGTDRLTSGMAAFPGGRQLGFTVSTQLAGVQGLTLLGTSGRITLDIPYNCPPDHVARLVIDDGRDHLGSGRVIEEIPPADQYQLQAEAFAAAIHGAPLAAGLEDARANAAAIAALMRSLDSGRWETP